ncbi:MAG: DNA gyrase inhibitor YacG [Burkholderiales bacterium]|nr:DNA gyrase inhibitor YacG [Burkholderiales bacterium]
MTAESPVRQVPCPGCRRPAAFTPENRWRPFCSERCKTGDLGAWASNAYVIEGPPIDESSDQMAGPDTYPAPTHPPGRA